jgi:hypothetical protein
VDFALLTLQVVEFPVASFPVQGILSISAMDLESKYCYFYHGWDFVPYKPKRKLKEDRTTSIKHCAPRISSKMATIDECIEFALKNIGL